MSNFGPLFIGQFEDTTTDHYLAMVNTHTTQSLITLTLNADSMKFIVNMYDAYVWYFKEGDVEL